MGLNYSLSNSKIEIPNSSMQYVLSYILLLPVGTEVIVLVSDCFLKALDTCKLIHNPYSPVNIVTKDNNNYTCN